MTGPLGPMRNSVGIREVRSDGETLPGAMVLDVEGGVVTFVAASGNEPAKYVLDATLFAVLSTAVSVLEGRCLALENRCTELERKQFTKTALKTADYTAVAWEHVFVDMDAASGDVTITLPTSPAPTIGDRVRISDESGVGGEANGFSLKVACTFAPTNGTPYTVSPYAIAFDPGANGSLIGASIELIYVGTGWYVISETCQPRRLL